ncbi:hypothetical protein OKW24_004652 [Peribacillus simplex]|nr:hypothetical protein [Peribacillus simplex]
MNRNKEEKPIIGISSLYLGWFSAARLNLYEIILLIGKRMVKQNTTLQKGNDHSGFHNIRAVLRFFFRIPCIVSEAGF